MCFLNGHLLAGTQRRVLISVIFQNTCSQMPGTRHTSRPVFAEETSAAVCAPVPAVVEPAPLALPGAGQAGLHGRGRGAAGARQGLLLEREEGQWLAVSWRGGGWLI